MAADPGNPAGPVPTLSPNGMRSNPKCGSKPGRGGANGGVGGRLVVTEGAFKPKRVFDDVIFGVPREDVRDGFEESRALKAVKESLCSRDGRGLLFLPCCLLMRDDRAAAESALHGDDVISPVTSST